MTKTVVVVGLVILILLLAIPLGIGMAMGMCPDCSLSSAPGALLMCATLVLAVVASISIFTRGLRPVALGPLLVGVARTPERPPRFS